MMAPLFIVFFTLSCLLTAAVSAVFGMGGGILLLGIFAILFSAEQVALIIPFHATIQMISNFTRLLLFIRYVEWKIVRFFLLGVFPGSLLGIYIFQFISTPLLQILMGVFVLAATFYPQKEKEKQKEKQKDLETKETKEKEEVPSSLPFSIFIPAGFVVGMLGVFFGATGPLTAPIYLRMNILKERMIATKAICQFFSHLLKIFLFAQILNANVLRFSSLLLIATVAVIAGTFLGKFVLSKLPEKHFKTALKVALALISLRLIWKGMEKYL